MPTSDHNPPEAPHDRFPYPLDFARPGYDAVIEPGMTLCIESFPFEADLLA